MGSNPSYFRGPDRPVEQVLWSEVQEFLLRLNTRHDGYYRLPTEADWECCARAGSAAQFGANRLDGSAWYGAYNGNTLTDTPGETHLVGQKTPNAWSLYDVDRILLRMIEYGGPLLYHCSEDEQISFDSTCRKFRRFLTETSR